MQTTTALLARPWQVASAGAGAALTLLFAIAVTAGFPGPASVLVDSIAGWGGNVAISLLMVPAVGSAALALFLLRAGRKVVPAIQLGCALGWISPGAMYFMLHAAASFSAPRALHPGWLVVLGTGFGAVLAVGVQAFECFWLVFPRSATPLSMMRRMHRIEPQLVGRPSVWLNKFRFLRAFNYAAHMATFGPWFPLIAAAALAVSNLLAGGWGLSSIGIGERVGVFILINVLCFPPVAVTVVYCVYFYWKCGTPEEREKIRWLHLSLVLTAWGILLPQLLIGAIALSLLLVPGVGDPLTIVELARWAARSLLAGVVAAPLVFFLALTASILHKGILDARLAVSRITVWSLMAVLSTVIFVLVERAAVLWVVSSFGLDPATGTVVGGAVVAGTFQPIRNRVERFARDVVVRRLPASLLASGSREEGAVLIADIAGYTALSAINEPAAILSAALLQQCAREAAARHGGHYIKSLGDGCLLVFPEAPAAVRAASGLHAQFGTAAAAAALPGVQLHSGIHWGEFLRTDDADVYGQTVNVAARIADRAAATEIVVSQVLAARLDGRIAMAPLGPQRFKNVAGEVDCLRLA